MRFAEQEAARGNRALLDRINKAIDEAPQEIKDEIRKRYGRGEKESAEAYEARLRDEIWAALRERNTPAMEKAIKTLQGKAWYNRAWNAIKELYRDFMRSIGRYDARLDKLDKMSPDEAARHILKEMAAGRRFAGETGGGDGVREAAAMAKFSGGRDYVHVDTDQHLFDGKPEKEFPKIAHRVILDKFRGKVIGDAPQTAYVKTKSAGEFAYPGKPLDGVADAAKMRSAPELDNLL